MPAQLIRRVAVLSSALFAVNCSQATTLPSRASLSRDEEDVRHVLADWLGALERNDLKALEEIIAPDYTITAEGRVMNRTQDLDVVRTGRVKFQSATSDSVRVRIFGDAAVVTGIGAYAVLLDGKPLRIRERFTDVYARRRGKWEPVASHTTPLRG
ncbi:MAG TPA: nuclear transport factor 2 family protein [Gemmatimonadaceae bacterium]|nr:nuclear transport factor 2 family protein [Gemmatimonadaceae bacterium]